MICEEIYQMNACSEKETVFNACQKFKEDQTALPNRILTNDRSVCTRWVNEAIKMRMKRNPRPIMKKKKQKNSLFQWDHKWGLWKRSKDKSKGVSTTPVVLYGLQAYTGQNWSRICLRFLLCRQWQITKTIALTTFHQAKFPNGSTYISSKWKRLV